MNVKSLLIIPAAMLLALSVTPREASAENFPGSQARPLVASAASCFSYYYSGIYNNNTTGCSGYQDIIMPLMGNSGGTQTLVASVFTNTSDTSDIECIWYSTDTNSDSEGEVNSGWTSPSTSGQGTISFSMGVYNPGASYLECELKPNARLNTVTWTM